MDIKKHMHGLLGFFVGVAITFAGYQMHSPAEAGAYEGTFNKEGKKLSITVKTYEGTEEINRLYKLVSGKDKVIGGFAMFSEEHDVCTLYVPKGKEHMTLWGHELAHCVYGHWHE